MAEQICDLHIHSKYARATSADCAPGPLDLWARKKGIQLVGTGDCTHAAWRSDLKEALIREDSGLYRLKPELRLPLEGPCSHGEPRFAITGEISTIYKKNGKTRKVHHVILLPSLEDAEHFSQRLEGHGANLHSDGRPILGLDSRDLLEMLLDACPQALLIPAHIWTPHFSLFGAFSGFDTLEECYEDLSGHIHALETGLSSDPPMNWQWSQLDKYLLVSNSDAHSPAKLGREATLLKGDLSWQNLYRVLNGQCPENFGGTLEFYPEEGKYHFDGHRNCGVCLDPAAAQALDGLCPTCSKRMTFGVYHRCTQLADRPEGFQLPAAAPFERLVPLQEIAAASLGVSPASKKAAALYEQLINQLGSEFHILRHLSLDEVEKSFGPCLREALRRVRKGQLHISPGYDGEFGKVEIFAPGEREAFGGQTSFLSAETLKPQAAKKAAAKAADVPAHCVRKADQLNEEQQAAVISDASATAVVAGPGTGKTKTLTARVLHLIKERRIPPEAIACVTFTQKAAEEMKTRLTDLMPREAKKVRIGTFHSLCLRLVDGVTLLSPEEQRFVAKELIFSQGWNLTPEKLLLFLSRYQATGQIPEGLPEEAVGLYIQRLNEIGAVDFDGLLTRAFFSHTPPPFAHLLVDEFQDVSPLQYRLTLKWAAGCQTLFVIGDPDQAIYGFRGASSACFDQLRKDRPDLRLITLTQNYRSTPQILSCAQAAIQPNGGGSRGLQPNRPDGVNVECWQAAGEFGEALAIAKAINRLVGGMDMSQTSDQEAACSFSDIAILYRTHRQAEMLEKCLLTEGIPYRVTGRSPILEEDVIREALAFFRHLREPERPALLSPRHTQAHVDALRPLIRKEKPGRLLASYQALMHFPADPAWEHLSRIALCYPDMPSFLDALTLGEEGDVTRCGLKVYRTDAVTLSTLHGAKGLEFPVVFLAGLKESVLPLERPGLACDLMEERRLFYVGVTRAKEQLILSTHGPKSPFLRFLDVKTLMVGPDRIDQGKQLSFF
ncbi:MAG: UvrD-helicase domain-containing protein [Clostridia bacterium]|nr:UvrD-helicase domain-containing protein [Clostridia bacterium]